jgi:hypothetical protein
VPLVPNCTDNRNVEKIRETIENAEADCGAPVKMIVIDTLSRALGGGDDSDAKDTKIIAAAEYWKRKTCPCPLFWRGSWQYSIGLDEGIGGSLPREW